MCCPSAASKRSSWPPAAQASTTIILPAENRQNVEEDLNPELLEGVAIHYASRIDDVLAVALPLLQARPDTIPAQPSAAPTAVA